MSPKRSIVRRIFLALLVLVLCSQPGFAALTLDPTFGDGGKVTIDFPDTSTNYTSSGMRIFSQSGGRIVGGGMFTNRGPDGQFPGVGFAGFLTTGALDTTYGNQGTIRDWDPISLTSFSDAYMYPDGRVIRVSQVFSLSFPLNGPKAIRLNPDGTIDGGFSANLSVVGSNNAIPLEVVAGSDGKIYVLVYAQGSPASYHLYRLNPDGSRDSAFGTNGAMLMNFGRIVSPSLSFYMELFSDGRILLAGNAGPSDSSGYSEFFMMRLDSNGHMDKSFGRQGVLRTAFGPGQRGSLNNAYIQADGRILLVGSISTPDHDVWMARFSARGRVDTSFGNAGVVVADLVPGDVDRAAAAVQSADGKIRIAGDAGSPTSFLVARFTSAGVLEEQVTTPFTPGASSAASDVTLQPDGKLIVIGHTRNPDTRITGNVWAIARYTE